MAVKKCRIQVEVAGTARNVMTLTEEAKGDVYIRAYSGGQVGTGSEAIAVVEDRYSLHPSEKSTENVTLKHTLALANGEKRTSVALSDAVKTKSGFSHVFSHRTTELKGPAYDVASDDTVETISLGNFDRDAKLLIFNVFVGPPRASFTGECDWGSIQSIDFDRFQIVIVHTQLETGSIPFALSIASFTYPPEVHRDEFAKINAQQMMKGSPPDKCLEIALGMTRELFVDYLEFCESISDNEDVRRQFREMIEQIPRNASFRM